MAATDSAVRASAEVVDRFLEQWHRAVAARDTAAIARLLADDVEIGAPPYWTRIQGHALAAHLLGLILTLVEDFTYHRQWKDGAELALEFTGRVDGKDLQGIDLVTVNADGRVASLDVLMRPIKSMTTLFDLMAPRVQDFLARGQ